MSQVRMQSRSCRVDLLSHGARGGRAKARCLATLVGLVIAGLGSAVPSALAAATPMVDLGDASSYAVLSGASVGNTVSAPGAPHTTLRGDLGVKANTQPTGFPPGVVTGAKNIGNAAADDAHADLVAAYTEVAGRTGGAPLPGALAGATLTPGLHAVAGAVSNTTTVTLDGQGDPNAVFVFQVNGAMAMAAGSHVVLRNGARASRVFWQVNGAGAVGANADFAGTLMALDAVAVGNGTMFNGRAFARNGALTLDANELYSAPPVVAIDGGAAATTTDTSPTISGTTNVQSPALVTVRVNGQTLTATPSEEGSWSVTPTILANGTYAVDASTADGAGNEGNATQALTVDTVLPVVTLDGGAAVTTSDTTPTIAGTSDVAAGTLVSVAVGSQSLSAVVHTGGAWNITPSVLTDGTWTVTASVTDPAGNQGAASQSLTIDTTPPPLTIAGGANRLTNDATPDISGIAAVAAGAQVTVTLADETLTDLVDSAGAWSVTATALSDGPHRIVVSVPDAAGNGASATQTLTVDTVSPVVTITGGATSMTTDVEPTIVGTSDAAPDTTVTVSIAGQTMTTLLQSIRSWNATPNTVGVGTWPVVATVTDPAGNVGTARQTLTITTSNPGDPGDPGLPGPGGPGNPIDPGQPVPAGPLDTPAPTPPVGGGSINAVATTKVAPNSRQKVKRSALSIGTKVTAPAGGRVLATVTGTVKIKSVRRAIKLTTATATIVAGQSTTLKLKPMGSKKAIAAASKTIEAAAKKGKKVSATITVRLVDAAGHKRDVTRKVQLTK